MFSLIFPFVHRQALDNRCPRRCGGRPLPPHGHYQSYRGQTSETPSRQELHSKTTPTYGLSPVGHERSMVAFQAVFRPTFLVRFVTFNFNNSPFTEPSWILLPSPIRLRNWLLQVLTIEILSGDRSEGLGVSSNSIHNLVCFPEGS